MKDRDYLTPRDLVHSIISSKRAAGRIGAAIGDLNKDEGEAQTDLNGVNINNYIATLTDLASNSLIRPYTRDRLIKETGMYAFLRDKHGAQTVGDARIALEHRVIDPGIVGLWLDEGMATCVVDDAILKGYPELDEAMKAAKARERAELGLPE
ncbi:hypothetical protein HYW39_01680 [Candidatus Curtissbacteria bacterium]|nr:hypothetical protein [Candidatus Curtissbacteria bacterium]